MEALYPGYKAIFMFDNAKSHAIFAKDALQVNQMSKSPGGVQLFIQDGWYQKEGIIYPQSMSYSESNETSDMT